MTSAARRGLWTFLRFAAVACIAAVLLTLGSAAQGDPPPPDVSLTLGVGASKAFKPTIHFDQLPPRADVLLAIDSTGSMGQAITDAKADADTLVQQIQSEIPTAKFALADFKDYPQNPFTGTFGEPTDYPWRVDQDFTINGTDSTCTDGEFFVTKIACALNGIQPPGPDDGGDIAESYNRAFYEAYSDTTHLHWDDGAARFMVVLGDSLPHDAALNTFDPVCPNAPPTDPGSAFTVGNDQYSATNGALDTATVLGGLKTAHTNLSFVTYNPTFNFNGQVPACHLALAQYTGGSAVTHDSGTCVARHADLEPRQPVGLTRRPGRLQRRGPARRVERRQRWLLVHLQPADARADHRARGRDLRRGDQGADRRGDRPLRLSGHRRRRRRPALVPGGLDRRDRPGGQWAADDV